MIIGGDKLIVEVGGCILDFELVWRLNFIECGLWWSWIAADYEIHVRCIMTQFIA